ncbi:hypothetical protein IEQ34_008820 [Dendrobium chrysotoxum]|uniref:Uncharacterized protein n=1 Tax=Dendrobium chrysotoxum TaxID=161865 RepID=A0AAV7GYW6_DENCH|nr:hypothetical protein IEQ34_008820 [Dendrobium chrysotoxum]
MYIYQERAAKNSANAKKQTCPHTMGHVSSIRRQKETSINDILQLWKINRMYKDGTWSSEDTMHRWTQACNLLAEEGLTPEDGNIEANERVFTIVMGPEHSGGVRTQGFGVTSTRCFPQSKSEEGGGSDNNFGQIASLREEFKSFRDNQIRDFSSFCDEMRQFMQQFQPPNGGSEMLHVLLMCVLYFGLVNVSDLFSVALLPDNLTSFRVNVSGFVI